MGKNKDEQSFWQDKLSLLKRVGFIAFASMIALGVPTVSDVVGKVSPLSNLDVSAAEAQTNLMNVNDILTQFNKNHNEDKEHWAHTFQNDGDMNVSGPDFDLTDLTYVVKIPGALSHLLDDKYVTNYLFGNVTNFDTAQSPFMITGHVIDANGDKVTINKEKHKPYKYISINKATNSIEFDFNSFYTENNLKPSINTNISGEYIFENLGFQTPIIVPHARILDNGTYEFKSAIVRGKSVDLDKVSNAHSESLIVDYSKVPDVDSEALEALVAEANGYESVHYTESSFADLTATIAEAEVVLGDEAVTQGQVDAALADLKLAIEGLEMIVEPVPEIDKGLLKILVAEANNFDEDDYTQESYADLTATIAGAEVVLGDESATQKQVDAALVDLQVAIKALENIGQPVIDKGGLEILLAEANNFDADDYTQESFAKLTATIAEAEVVLVLGDEAATQKQIDAALVDLQDTIEALEMIVEPVPEIDKGELEALVAEAKNFDADDYTQESFADLTASITEAEVVLGDEAATQKQIDAALANLQVAIEGLEAIIVPEPVIDTSKLEALIDDAKDFNANDYTVDTFAALTSAIKEANVALGNELVTQEQIDFALTELQAAIDGLVKAKKPVPEEPKVPGDGGKFDGDNGKTNSGENPINVDKAVDDSRLPSTATNMFSLLLIGSILSLSGGLLIFFRRKKLANI